MTKKEKAKTALARKVNKQEARESVALRLMRLTVKDFNNGKELTGIQCEVLAIVKKHGSPHSYIAVYEVAKLLSGK